MAGTKWKHVSFHLCELFFVLFHETRLTCDICFSRARGEAVQAFPDKPPLVTEFGIRCVCGLRGNVLFTEDLQAECIRTKWRAIRENAEVAGGVLWCCGNYYHRRDFIEYAAFEPYGVLTVDRKPARGWRA